MGCPQREEEAIEVPNDRFAFGHLQNEGGVVQRRAARDFFKNLWAVYRRTP